MIKKKHITLCFSLFLALSMFLGQLIPVTAEDNTVPAEDQTTETAEPTPEPEVTEDDQFDQMGTDSEFTDTVVSGDAESGDSVASEELESGDNGFTATENGDTPSTLAEKEYSIEVGESKTISGNGHYIGSDHAWSSSDTGIATVQANGSSATVTGVSEGTATITHTYKSLGQNYKETFTVIVTKPQSKIATVYVYIAAMDRDGNRFSKEMTDLLGIKYDSINGSGYFAAGTVQLDLSGFTDGNKTSTILNSDADWNNLIDQLKANKITTANVIESANQANKINDYIDQAIRDKNNITNGSKLKLGSYSKTSNGSNNDGNTYQDGTTYDVNGNNKNNDGGYTWHLDLRFETVHINYIYGHNNIDTGECKDNTPAGSKVFIKGATMDKTPELGELPQGYRVAGYYTTEDFQPGTEWDGIGEPILTDTTVYIKIVPKDNVVINYIVKEGQGTVTDPSKNDAKEQTGMDSFNPFISPAQSPKGSTAEPAADWQFEGWYSDEELTIRVSTNEKYTPSAPDGEWDNTTQYNYYAKFVPKTKKIYVENNITGNAADTTKDFTYHLVVTDENNNKVTNDISLSDGKTLNYDSEKGAHVFTLSHGQSIETEPLPQYYSFSVTQQNTTEAGEHDDGYKTSLTTNCNTPSGSLSTNSHGHALNHQDLTEKDRAEVVFKNEKSLTVPSGLSDHDNYLSAFMLAAGSSIILLALIIGVRRRMSAN